jgi:hypothetical protein
MMHLSSPSATGETDTSVQPISLIARLEASGAQIVELRRLHMTELAPPATGTGG